MRKLFLSAAIIAASIATASEAAAQSGRNTSTDRQMDIGYCVIDGMDKDVYEYARSAGCNE
jgi:hypothetical protein